MATYWENSCSFGLRYVSWYKYLIVSLVFSHLGFWSGNLFLIAPFPDLCLLVPFYSQLGAAAWLRTTQSESHREKTGFLPMRKQRVKCEISRFLLASVLVQRGLCRSWSEFPKTDFLASRLI